MPIGPPVILSTLLLENNQFGIKCLTCTKPQPVFNIISFIWKPRMRVQPPHLPETSHASIHEQGSIEINIDTGKHSNSNSNIIYIQHVEGEEEHLHVLLTEQSLVLQEQLAFL